MKVKIIKANKYLWYADKVGEIFDVEYCDIRNARSSWNAHVPSVYRVCKYTNMYISVNDCIEVSDIESLELKLKEAESKLKETEDSILSIIKELSHTPIKVEITVDDIFIGAQFKLSENSLWGKSHGDFILMTYKDKWVLGGRHGDQYRLYSDAGRSTYQLVEYLNKIGAIKHES